MSKPKKGKRFNYPLKTLLKVRDIRQRQQQEKLNTAEKELQTQQQKALLPYLVSRFVGMQVDVGGVGGTHLMKNWTLVQHNLDPKEVCVVGGPPAPGNTVTHT